MEEQLFDKKKLLKLIIPVAIEQTLVVIVGMADMIMVSKAGEHAVSGISLVNSICILLLMVFNALAASGSIIIAQYIGQKNYERACKSASASIVVSGTISIILSCITLIFNEQILRLIYGSVDDSVMQSAITYLKISALSFPFLALYNASAGIFRVMNNAKISLQMSFIMNTSNILLNAVFIYGFSMEVAGVAYSTLISRMIASILILIRLKNKNNIIYIEKLEVDKDLISKILKLGIPQALENSMFQVGKLFTQSLISSFGTAAIAANACASTVETMANVPVMAMSVALITVVGQCVGYGDYKQARKNAIIVLKYTYTFLFIINPIMFVFAEEIAGWYNLTPEGTAYAVQIIRYYNICCMLIAPLSFTIPSVFKASGDVKYTLAVSMFSMWVFRIGAAYLITYIFDLSVFGVWVAMTIDWAVRSTFNVIRFRSDKWENKALTK